MIWLLRNIGVRLWIAVLFAIPLSFYLLPGITRLFSGISPVTACFFIITGVVVTVGFLMDMTAQKAVMHLIKEGQAWERSQIFNKAENSYIKAVRIYDTFLLWPFSAKKITKKLSGAIARFELNTSIDNQNFDLATSVYLKINPKDEVIASLWLKHVQQASIVSALDQEVLSLLAETHYANHRLSSVMADIFLGMDRKDFTAKKLYQQVQKEPEFEKTYPREIEAIIGNPVETLQKEAFFFQPERKPRKKLGIGEKIQFIIGNSVSFLKSGIVSIGSVLRFLVLSAGRVLRYVKDHEKSQFYLKIGFIGVISICLVFFIISTLSHTFKSKTVEKENEKIEIQVPKPFTIQVAAYLKQEYADNYTNTLKKKGIDATVKKVNGGGKTWFVVRVSEFIDKKSAETYGQELKQQKIIDDFFVNNK